MNKGFKIPVIVLLLGACFGLPIYFEEILSYIVSKLGFGWVFSSFLIRFFVIFFFSFVLKLSFSFIPKLAKINFLFVFLIALLPGFVISFIYPIYTVDYGLRNDGFKLEHPVFLNDALHVDELPENGHVICAFFTTSCMHCVHASKKLGSNIEAGQVIQVYAFFPANESIDPFLGEFKGESFIPHVVESDSLLIALSGGIFPSIFLINSKGETEYHWTGDELNYTALDYLKSLEQ